jgi:hypothetical protein
MLKKLRLVVFIFVLSAILMPNASLTAQNDLRIESFGALSDFEEITFTIEPGDVSVLFHARAADAEDNVIIVELIGPNGETLYIEDEETGDITSELFTDLLISPHEVAMYLPPAPQFELEPGEYTVVVLTEFESDISDAGIIVRSGDVDVTQAIDINLFVLTDEVSASDFDTIEREVRREMDSILAPRNMRLGNVNFTTGSAAQKQRFSTTVFGEEDLINVELLELCQAMGDEIGYTRALNVALVDFVGDDGTAGIATGLPGSPMVEGSPISCVVAALQDDSNFSANTQGINILHEGAHLMGMTHTTESEGTFFDLFADTPECSAAQFDTDNDGEVSDPECENADGNNFMFWSEGGLEMSPDQAWTLRRHPLFYPL